MTDRNPPQDVEAEQAVLGAMLTSRTACREVADMLTGLDFYRPAHETIFDAIVAVDGRNEPADPVTVAAELERTQMLERVGGRLYLHEVFAAAPVGSDGTHYAALVREQAGKRRLIEASIKISQDAYESPLPAQEQAENARALFDKTMPDRAHAETFREALPRVIGAMESGVGHGLSTGWPDLDSIVYGLQPGRLYVVGARPGIGKSILALQWALHMWQQHDKATYFASLEMNTDEIVQRSLALTARVPLGKIITGRLDELEWDRVGYATTKLAESKVVIEDAGHQTIGSIRSGARTLARRGELGLVAIDYLQLVSARDPRVAREQQVAEISRNAKILAKELEVPVLLLSQLNRQMAGRADKTPTLTDLRESGAIEQDADMVGLLHKPEEDTNEIDLYVAKNRSGAQGVAHFIRQGEFARLVPASRG